MRRCSYTLGYLRSLFARDRATQLTPADLIIDSRHWRGWRVEHSPKDKETNPFFTECIGMRGSRMVRAFQFVATGLVLLQVGGCTTSQFLELVQTVFLGITAAGSFAIIQNI